MTKTIAIIQARMTSTRLPGKVLKEIAGKPMLDWVVGRARRAKTVDEVLVATTIEPADDLIAEHCSRQGYSIYRGSRDDVLDRYYQAAKLHQAGTVVRLTADCPLIDPGLIDQTVQAFYQAGVDFAANRLPPPFHRTFPIGLDVEVCSFSALERAWKEAIRTFEREHVMPYLYEEPGRFRVLTLDHDPDYGALRWTVDTPEDLEVVREIFSGFPGREDFGWEEVIELVERQPELLQGNNRVRAKDYRESEK